MKLLSKVVFSLAGICILASCTSGQIKARKDRKRTIHSLTITSTCLTGNSIASTLPWMTLSSAHADTTGANLDSRNDVLEPVLGDVLPCFGS